MCRLARAAALEARTLASPIMRVGSDTALDWGAHDRIPQRAGIRPRGAAHRVDRFACCSSILALVDLESEGKPVRVDGFRLRDLERLAHRARDLLAAEPRLPSPRPATATADSATRTATRLACSTRSRASSASSEALTRRDISTTAGVCSRESKGFFEPLANPDFLTLFELMREHDPEPSSTSRRTAPSSTEELHRRVSPISRPVYVNVSLISVGRGRRAGGS